MPYFRRDLADGVVSERRFREFYVLTPFFAAGMLLVVLANSLGVMWIAVEAVALSSVLLVALYNQRTSLEAAWKYVILGGLGLVLALFGTIFTYAAAVGKTGEGTMPSFNWSRLLALAPQLDHHLMTLAFIFVLVGYGTKAGLAPMHTWLPDAHSEAPSPTSAMLSGVSLKIALYALLRFHILATACLGSGLSRNLLLGFGLFSMLLAGPFILVQKNLKRMLAYSSLEHVGLICAAIGMNAPLTVFGAMLHMGYHALAKPVLFFAAGNIHQQLSHAGFPASRRRAGANHAGDGPVAGPGRRGRERPAALRPVRQRTDGALRAASRRIMSGLASSCWRRSSLSSAACSTKSPDCCSVRAMASGQPRETISAGSVAAMSLPLGALLLFTIWLPAPRQLMEQAAGIIGGRHEAHPFPNSGASRQ